MEYHNGISLWSVGVGCPAYVPSQSLALAHPQPTGRWGKEAEMSLLY